ncbi:MAG: kelch repeat-containing protein [Aggregatilineales bacterium]
MTHSAQTLIVYLGTGLRNLKDRAPRITWILGALASFLLFTLIYTPVFAAPSTYFTELQWSQVASQPYSNSEGQGVVVDGLLYSFGGFDSTHGCCRPTRRTYSYNPDTNIWTRLRDMPKGSTHSGMTTDGTNIFYAGGYIENASQTGQIFGTNEAWRYNVASDTYTQLPNLPAIRAGGQLAYVAGKLYYVGGSNLARNQDVGDLYMLDIANSATSWTTLASLPNPRHHMGIATINGLIYVVGGQHRHDGNLIAQDDVHVYNPSTNAWTQVADLPSPRNHITSTTVVVDDRIIVLGGQQAHNTSFNTVFDYDPVANEWSSLNNLPFSRHSAVGGVIGEYIYFSTGYNIETWRGKIIRTSLDPELMVNFTTPLTQVNNGADVEFTVTLENTGDFTFSSINVTGSPVTACNRVVNNLLVGDISEYTCTANNVTSAFTNTIDITATASNNDVLNISKEVAVSLTPGHITIVNDVNPPNVQDFDFFGTNGIGAFTLGDNGENAYAPVNVKVNFQSVGAIIPPGYIADTGAAFNATPGFGWIREDSVNSPTHVPLNITGNGRDRQRFNTDQRYDTIMHIQYSGTNGVPTPAAWEYTLLPGLYTVHISVGDQPPYDSLHIINLEGQRYLRGFSPDEDQEYYEFTVTLPVLDGRLTVDAIGGTNTKINFIEISGTPTPPNGHFIYNLPPDTYTITETVPAGWMLNTIICSGGGTTQITNGIIANVNSGSNIVCTFANGEDTSPPTIQQIAPNTTITDSLGDPTYEWTSIPNATSYGVYVEKTNGSPQIINTSLSYTAANCDSEGCAVDLTNLSETYRLVNGTYNWYVRPIVNGVAGDWVGPQAFNLDVPAPSLITFSATTGKDTVRPTFHWALNGDADNASYFQLYLLDGNGAVQLNQWYSRVQACGTESSTSCNFQSPNELVDETEYRLYVLSYGAGGYSTGGPFGNGYAGPETFLVSLAKPQPISPNGVVDLPLGNPQYTWTDINGATYYYLYVANQAGQQVIYEVISDIGNCNGTQCQIDMTTIRESYRLPAGIYTFYVRGFIGATELQTPWSSPMTFTINSNLPPIVTKLTPAMDSNEAGPNVTFSWQEIPTAVGYEIIALAPDGTVPVNYRGVAGDQITCAANECSLTRALGDIPGVWTWFARAYNAIGDGGWSPANSAADNYGGFTFTMPIPLPTVVNKISPVGTVNSDLLTLTWEHQTGASAYEIYISGPAGFAYFEAKTVGAGVTCSTNCTLALQFPSVGTYTWYVRGINEVGAGAWEPDDANGDYGAFVFNINLTLPGVIAKNTPSASEVLTNLETVFSWQHDSAATKYELYMTGPNGYVYQQTHIINQVVTCASNCQITLNLPANGAYLWYIRGGNAAGFGNWSALNSAADNYGAVAFSVNMPLPAVIAKVTPTESQNFADLDVTFEWVHDSAATIYNLYMTGPNSFISDQNLVVGQGVTCATNCSLTMPLPANGAYIWYLRGGNAAGFGNWSPLNSATDNYGAINFTVGQPLPDAISKIAPSASAILDNLAVNFSWQPDANATKYEISVTGPSGYVHNQTYTVGAGVTCASNCALTLNLPANGAYVWYVRGGNEAGMGNWSPLNSAADNYGAVAFSVNMPLPGVVSKVSPQAASTSTVLEVPFQWTHLAGATRYELSVVGPNSFVHNQTYTVGAGVTCASTCTKTITVPANGNYTWYVRAGNAAGMGNWSPLNSAADNLGGVQFLVAVQIPIAPALVSPADDAVIYQTNRPTFTWNTVANATYYHLEIRNGMNAVVVDQWFQNTTVCTGSTCTHQLVNPIAYGGYTWRMQSYNIAGTGPYSTARDFLSLSANIQPLMVQVENGLITRSGTWTAQSSERAVGMSYLQSGVSTADTLTMTFTGTTVDVVYIAGPQYGTFVVEIDGVPQRGVNATSATLAFGQIASFTDLADGEHTLRIVPLGGSPVAVDALVVNGEVLATTPAPTVTPIVIDPVTETPTDVPAEETPVVIPVNPTQEAPVIIDPTPAPTETPSGAEATAEATTDAP